MRMRQRRHPVLRLGLERQGWLRPGALARLRWWRTAESSWVRMLIFFAHGALPLSCVRSSECAQPGPGQDPCISGPVSTGAK